jgi:hypothetical protein
LAFASACAFASALDLSLASASALTVEGVAGGVVLGKGAVFGVGGGSRPLSFDQAAPGHTGAVSSRLRGA